MKRFLIAALVLALSPGLGFAEGNPWELDPCPEQNGAPTCVGSTFGYPWMDCTDDCGQTWMEQTDQNTCIPGACVINEWVWVEPPGVFQSVFHTIPCPYANCGGGKGEVTEKAGDDPEIQTCTTTCTPVSVVGPYFYMGTWIVKSTYNCELSGLDPGCTGEFVYTQMDWANAFDETTGCYGIVEGTQVGCMFQKARVEPKERVTANDTWGQVKRLYKEE